MSDPKNLGDFFAQNSKKKKTKKAGAAKATPAAASEVSKEEVKETPIIAEPEKQAPAEQDFADSSDEESNQIVINEGRQKIIDRKDLDASKKNKEEEATDSVAGWGLGSKLGQVEESTSAPSFSAAKGPQTGGSKMNFGKPTFTRKQKGIMDTQDFPDLDDAAKGSGQDAGQSKANSAMQYSFGAAAKGARDPAAPEEENKAAMAAPKSKPVFKGKAKLNLGGASNEEVANSRMNYDFSKMRMSAATAKKSGEGAEGEEGEKRPEGQERKPRGERHAPASFAGGFDDDFETVVAEKKKPPRRNFDEPKFGGGMPSFTRGTANRQD